jgi:hypothetical protein
MMRAHYKPASYGGDKVDRRVLIGLIALFGALAAIDRFYEHPTYGTGLAALVAVLRAGETL